MLSSQPRLRTLPLALRLASYAAGNEEETTSDRLPSRYGHVLLATSKRSVWMCVRDGIGMAMDQLPHSVFPSERACHSEIERGNCPPVTDTCPPRFVLHDTGKIVSDE